MSRERGLSLNRIRRIATFGIVLAWMGPLYAAERAVVPAGNVLEGASNGDQSAAPDIGEAPAGPPSAKVSATATDRGPEGTGKRTQEGSAEAGEIPSPDRYVTWAWEASGRGDLDRLNALVEACERHYGARAREQAASLKGFPDRGKEKDYNEMNDYATVLFIRAEALMNYGRKEEAVAAFQELIKAFPWAQAWDPRGWYWSIAEKSQASIDVMQGKVKEEEEEVTPGFLTLPKQNPPGREKVVDYRRYGVFHNVGTPDYRYEITDPRGLAAAVGEGIYPNTGSVLKDPAYLKAKKEGRLDGSHWDFVYSDDVEAAFFKWVTAPEPWGIRLFYIGTLFEKAGMYYEAIKAYQALIVHFPRTVGWTYWQTPWYPAQAAVAKIKYLIRSHPELNLQVRWMHVEVKNGFDNDIRNDAILTYPGVISRKGWWARLQERLPFLKKKVRLGAVRRTLGKGKVRLVQYENGHWRMFVDGKPFVIRGITYAPTKVGQSPDKGTLTSWMYEDDNHNGKPDGPYDAFVDRNGNNEQDPDEPTVGDFQLLKEMGVNTIREYHQPFQPNKAVLREMYEKFGFYVVMGDFLGKYTLGSGATWFEGTDYDNPEHKKNMMASVRRMVMEFKDEPYILMWILGNENNYGVASNADQKPESYFRFVNEVARMIKSIDPDHPVAICNGDTLYLDKFAEYAPDVDVFAANVYRGNYGFGAFWKDVFQATGKPAFITEYGCPAYARHLTKEEAEEAQAEYHRGNWTDIADNMAGGDGVGNALGGIAFEWLDEWWKNYEPFYHDRKSDAIGPFPGGYYYEEWFGLAGQGNGAHSPFLRRLRKSYFMYKEMWAGAGDRQNRPCPLQ